jgi:HEAT repeat protein
MCKPHGMKRSTPAARVEAAEQQWGCDEVIRRACLLVESRSERLAPDLLELAIVLGELSDPHWLSTGKGPGHRYWARVWAVRALLYVWNDAAGSAVHGALTDEHWRVREMAAKVAARREMGEAADALGVLLVDDVERVRLAAARALAVVGEGEHAELLERAACVGSGADVQAARDALEQLAVRLDRPF